MSTYAANCVPMLQCIRHSRDSCKNNCICMGGVILLCDHITQIPIFLSVFLARLTETKSILLQFKTLPGSLCPHRTLMGPPLPSAEAAQALGAATQFRPFLTPSLPVLSNWKSQFFAHYVICHCPFRQLSLGYQPSAHFCHVTLWLHLAKSLLHLLAVMSNTILPITCSSSHLPSAGYRRGLVILGWVSSIGVPLPWPCLLRSWQATEPQPSLH